MALSALSTSVITSACDTKSVPWPPHSFGTAMVRKPSLEPFLMMSQSQVSRAVGMASRASESGRISSSANLRAAICQERCSLLRVKSMGASSGEMFRLFADQRHRAITRAPVTGQLFGDAQLGVHIAVAGKLARAGGVWV